MKDRMIKASVKIAMFAVNIIWLYFLVQMVITYWSKPEVGFGWVLGPIVNAGIWSILWPIFFYVCFALFYLTSKYQKVTNYIITLAVMSLFTFLVNDVHTLQLEAMNARYKYLEQYGNYPKSDHFLLVKSAVDNKDIEQFVKLMENTDNVYETNLDQEIAILEIVDQITPNLKTKTLLFLKDNYLSRAEYTELKTDILKEIQNANLTGEQISMIRSFK